MKKLSQYILIIIASIILPTFSSPSLAKDCPIIPENVKEVTVKNSAATLRKEPKYSTKNKGTAINKSDKLTVIISKPELGPDRENNTHCWYKVRPVQASTQEDYWIADIGISEFPFESKNTIFLSRQYQANTNQITNFSILIIFIGLGALSVSGIIFSLYCISSFKEYDKQTETLQQKVEDSKKKINNVQNILEESKQQIANQFNNQVHFNTQLNQLLEVIKNTPKYQSFYLSPLLIEFITQFNHLNRDYFNDSRFQPLGLTKASSQGSVREDGRRLIQLESFNDISKDLFLQIMLDGENWLIPNITSPYIRQIMNNLEKYSEIFIVHPGSNILKLVMPAKIKVVDSGIWEIAEHGEFTQQYNIIPEIYMPSFYNLPSQDITSMPVSSPEINPKEIDLGILYYLRKNENASFIDLLSNLKCDQQHLRDRLLILQEEEFIKIINKTDENNTIYKML